MFKRHLIYHVTPIGNWLWNIEQLSKRIHIFNGCKFIAVAQGLLKNGEKLMPLSEVKKFLPEGCYSFPVENNIEIRETASLLPLLEQLHDGATQDNDITFYAHTKGTSRQSDPFNLKEAIRLWTEIMYGQLLDNVEGVESYLAKAPCVGCFKRYGRFGHFPSASTWHYSGTFFWFRNRDLFARNWREVPRMRYGAEGYLSTLFGPAESSCIFGEGVTNLYDLNYLRRVMAVRDGNIRSLQKRLGKAAVDNQSLPEEHVQSNKVGRAGQSK